MGKASLPTMLNLSLFLFCCFLWSNGFLKIWNNDPQKLFIRWDECTQHHTTTSNPSFRLPSALWNICQTPVSASIKYLKFPGMGKCWYFRYFVHPETGEVYVIRIIFQQLLKIQDLSHIGNMEISFVFSWHKSLFAFPLACFTWTPAR